MGFPNRGEEGGPPPSSAMVSIWLTPPPPSGGWRNMWTAPKDCLLLCCLLSWVSIGATIEGWSRHDGWPANMALRSLLGSGLSSSSSPYIILTSLNRHKCGNLCVFQGLGPFLATYRYKPGAREETFTNCHHQHCQNFIATLLTASSSSS